MGYHAYSVQITYLLYLKMTEKLNKPPYNKGLPILKSVASGFLFTLRALCRGIREHDYECIVISEVRETALNLRGNGVFTKRCKIKKPGSTRPDFSRY